MLLLLIAKKEKPFKNICQNTCFAEKVLMFGRAKIKQVWTIQRKDPSPSHSLLLMTLVTTPSPSSLSTMNSTTSMTFWYSTYWTTSPPTMFAISSEPMQCWGRGVHSKDWNPKVLQTNEPTNQLKDSLFDKVSTYPLHILSKRRLRTFNKVRQKKLLKMSKIKGGGRHVF